MISRSILKFFLVLGVMFFALQAIPSEGGISVRVLKGQDSGDYSPLLEAFKGTLSRNGIQAKYIEEVVPEGTSANTSAAGADLVLALGSAALRFAVVNQIKEPVVFSAAFMQPEKLQKSTNVSGSLLNVSAYDQLKTLTEALPSVKRVGIIYVAEENSSLVDEANEAAGRLKIQIKGYGISHAKEIPRISDMPIDAFWLVPNSITGQLPVIHHLLSTCFRYRIPILAIAPAYVKAGALLAVCPDYADIGRQSGEIAVQVLKGRPAGSIPFTRPRAFKIYINPLVTEKLRLKLSDKILKSAESVGGR